MADEFFLNETAYEGLMAELQSVGERVGDNFTTLSSVLLDYDGAWGTDDIGQAFAKKYIEENGAPADLKALAGVEDNLDEAGDTGKSNAKLFASLDEDEARKLDATPE